MKVKELIKQLQELDQETEVRISLRNGFRPTGTRPVKSLEPIIDQDTNKLGFYAIDVNTEFTYPEIEEKLFVPENKSDVEYK